VQAEDSTNVGNDTQLEIQRDNPKPLNKQDISKLHWFSRLKAKLPYCTAANYYDQMFRVFKPLQLTTINQSVTIQAQLHYHRKISAFYIQKSDLQKQQRKIQVVKYAHSKGQCAYYITKKTPVFQHPSSQCNVTYTCDTSPPEII